MAPRHSEVSRYVLRRRQRAIRGALGGVLVTLLVVALSVVGVWFATTGPLSIVGTASGDVASPDDPAAIVSDTLIAEDDVAAAASDSRAADFAVDPARTTWNYESNGEKVVYLTIDDGPSKNTQAVLDILDRYGAKATFFVTGIDANHYDMIGEEYRRGHTVGMHTFSHDYAQVYASVDAYFADLDAISAIVRDQIGYVPCFIRFPGGSSNTISANYTRGIMTALAADVQARGYQYYDWNASCGDGSVHTADELVDIGCAFGDYSNIVFLCHDSGAKDTTVEALPRIIEYYQGLGYTFKAIDRSTMVPHHGIGN